MLLGKLQLFWQYFLNGFSLIFSSFQSNFLLLLVPLWDSEGSSWGPGGWGHRLAPREPPFPSGCTLLSWWALSESSSGPPPEKPQSRQGWPSCYAGPKPWPPTSAVWQAPSWPRALPLLGLLFAWLQGQKQRLCFRQARSQTWNHIHGFYLRDVNKNPGAGWGLCG